jgi:hypothetical protein
VIGARHNGSAFSPKRDMGSADFGGFLPISIRESNANECATDANVNDLA